MTSQQGLEGTQHNWRQSSPPITQGSSSHTILCSRGLIVFKISSILRLTHSRFNNIILYNSHPHVKVLAPPWIGSWAIRSVVNTVTILSGFSQWKQITWWMIAFCCAHYDYWTKIEYVKGNKHHATRCVLQASSIIRAATQRPLAIQFQLARSTSRASLRANDVHSILLCREPWKQS